MTHTRNPLGPTVSLYAAPMDPWEQAPPYTTPLPDTLHPRVDPIVVPAPNSGNVPQNDLEPHSDAEDLVHNAAIALALDAAIRAGATVEVTRAISALVRK